MAAFHAAEPKLLENRLLISTYFNNAECNGLSRRRRLIDWFQPLCRVPGGHGGLPGDAFK